MAGGYMALGVQSASVDAFDALFAAQRDYVYGLAHALLRNPQDAEDVTQEVFLKVYRALAQYDPERASVRTWLATFVVNACRTHRRRNFLKHLLPAGQPYGQEAEEIALELTDPSPWAAPEAHVLRSELSQAVREVIARLRLEHRAVLVLHYYLDLSTPEIARTLNCPEGTVYSRLYYARRLVQAEWERRTARSE